MENIINPIAINAPAHAEMLREKNEAFLAKYDTDAKQIDYYTELAMHVFDVFEIDGVYAEEGTRENVAVWYENKQAQFALFRKHPYWDEEAKAIIFTQDEKREIAMEVAAEELDILHRYVRDKGYPRSHLVAALYRTLYDLHNMECSTETINDAFVDSFKRRMSSYDIPKTISRMLNTGTKITKFARKCFTIYPDYEDKTRDVTTLVDEHVEGERNYASFDKYFAKFADYLSELVVKKVTVVSLHFCDFLLMSNGNSWASCHFINSHNIFHEHNTNSYSGCYKQGCLSYALDEPSFIFYTLPNTYDGDEYYMQPKLNRMCCQYQNGIIITGKLYPNNESNLITRYRQTLQQIISDVADFPNSWTFSRNVERIMTFVRTDKDASHYRDYECDNQKPTISIARHGAVLDIEDSMTIGHQAYCVYCGCELDCGRHEDLQCSSHSHRYHCAHCGCVVEPGSDYTYEYNGEYYCDDCVFWCDYHERYESVTERCDLYAYGDDISVCEEARDRHYLRCDDCGEWYLKEDLHTDGVYFYCDDCDEDHHKCSKCGKYMPDSDDDMCENCKRVANGEVFVVPCDDYQVGDYVLLKKPFHCAHGQNPVMDSYAGCIMRITNRSWIGGFNLTRRIDDIVCDWNWDTGCFAGKVLGANESMLFRTLEV
jgi:hypothetical protein